VGCHRDSRAHALCDAEASPIVTVAVVCLDIAEHLNKAAADDRFDFRRSP
jgi:hypothetical protein